MFIRLAATNGFDTLGRQLLLTGPKPCQTAHSFLSARPLGSRYQSEATPPKKPVVSTKIRIRAERREICSHPSQPKSHSERACRLIPDMVGVGHHPCRVLSFDLPSPGPRCR
jgi:hypothetical protein